MNPLDVCTFPAGQALQTCDRVELAAPLTYVPKAQPVQLAQLAALLEALYLPLGHEVHCRSDELVGSLVMYFPAGQFETVLQAVAVVEVVNLPEGQEVQTRLLVGVAGDVMYVPGAQV